MAPLPRGTPERPCAVTSPGRPSVHALSGWMPILSICCGGLMPPGVVYLCRHSAVSRPHTYVPTSRQLPLPKLQAQEKHGRARTSGKLRITRNVQRHLTYRMHRA